MPPTEVECVGCGVTFSPEPRPGRPVQYHSAACKQAAWRLRTGRTGHEARNGNGRNAKMANERYRCRDCGAVAVGSDGLRAHRQLHRERGEAVPEWDVLTP